MIKARELNQMYSNTVKSYMDKGYWINPTTVAGHQGEICKVDLTNGVELIRVLMIQEWIHNYKEDFYRDFISIKELRYDMDASKERNTCNTVWNQSGEVINCTKYYYFHGFTHQFAKSDIYFNEEEANEIANKRKNRYGYDYYQKETFVKKSINFDKDKVLAIVHSHPGYKSVKRFQIQEVITTKNNYTIKIKDRNDLVISKRNR